ncbi:MAG: 23S rRNA (pseudouridine(1915)-N(3))-methyltransferase RlmH [Mangrovibacterium sp.]
MKLRLIVLGKTDQSYLQEGTELFMKRIVRYLPFEYMVIPELKNTRKLSQEQQKNKEGELLLSRLNAGDELILLDEKGKEFRSETFARFLEKKMLAGTRSLVFATGGPYGFSSQVYAAAGSKISLSRMTFPHQLVRLVFAEQLYRALTIINGEPYHHA